jgi:ABC-type multidrug transport system ATPase subunit
MVFVADSFGVSFRGRTVLRSATVWAEAGRTTAVLGRNGCGKSSLLRAALGLGPRDFGTVRFRDRVYERPRLPALAREGLFYLPDRELMSRRRTFGWHLDALRAWTGAPPRESTIPNWLEVGDLLDRRSTEMSAGERRRAELALAIVRRPLCLVADEPFSGLGPLDRTRVARALRTLALSGCAIVATGQEVEDLLRCADLVVWMTAGTTHWLGSSGEARCHAQFRRQCLGGSLDHLFD